MEAKTSESPAGITVREEYDDGTRGGERIYNIVGINDETTDGMKQLDMSILRDNPRLGVWLSAILNGDYHLREGSYRSTKISSASELLNRFAIIKICDILNEKLSNESKLRTTTLASSILYKIEVSASNVGCPPYLSMLRNGENLINGEIVQQYYSNADSNYAYVPAVGNKLLKVRGRNIKNASSYSFRVIQIVGFVTNTLSNTRESDILSCRLQWRVVDYDFMFEERIVCGLEHGDENLLLDHDVVIVNGTEKLMVEKCYNANKTVLDSGHRGDSPTSMYNSIRADLFRDTKGRRGSICKEVKNSMLTLTKKMSNIMSIYADAMSVVYVGCLVVLIYFELVNKAFTQLTTIASAEVACEVLGRLLIMSTRDDVCTVATKLMAPIHWVMTGKHNPNMSPRRRRTPLRVEAYSGMICTIAAVPVALKGKAIDVTLLAVGGMCSVNLTRSMTFCEDLTGTLSSKNMPQLVNSMIWLHMYGLVYQMITLMRSLHWSNSFKRTAAVAIGSGLVESFFVMRTFHSMFRGTKCERLIELGNPMSYALRTMCDTDNNEDDNRNVLYISDIGRVYRISATEFAKRSKLVLEFARTPQGEYALHQEVKGNNVYYVKATQEFK